MKKKKKNMPIVQDMNIFLKLLLGFGARELTNKLQLIVLDFQRNLTYGKLENYGKNSV